MVSRRCFKEDFKQQLNESLKYFLNKISNLKTMVSKIWKKALNKIYIVFNSSPNELIVLERINC